MISNQFWIHKNYDLIIDSLIELKKENIKPIILSTGTKFDWRSSTYYETLIKKIKKIDYLISKFWETYQENNN